MVDNGGERIRDRRTGEQQPLPGIVPTGADMDEDGSSVELDAELATEEDIPSTEEILQRAEEARRKGRKPQEQATLHAPPGGPAAGVDEGETKEKPFVPHDRGAETAKY